MSDTASNQKTPDASQRPSEEESALRRRAEEFYLPREMINAVAEIGEIPDISAETLIGIGFLDIADYTYLSKFLSPQENLTVLNGLYSVFGWVLKKHGGYLNKIAGDSLMFNYGGPIDPQVKDLEESEAAKHIARELFYTCVELQRVCGLFNQANENVLSQISETETVDAINAAYEIIRTLRNSYDLSASFNALFQIRIRVGAAMGRVLIGNFGPQGVRHWDVIGLPVIDAKRMESSAPIGGFRVTATYLEILEETGILREYFQRFRREAAILNSVYKDISYEDLYRYGTVRLKDKKNAEFQTFSVQVNPSLPEDITNQSRLLLQRGDLGLDRIVEFIEYYRGNRLVIDEMEKLFEKTNVKIRKELLLYAMLPRKFSQLLEEHHNDIEELRRFIHEQYSLFDLLNILGKLQDSVKKKGDSDLDEKNFEGYDRWVAGQHAFFHKTYKKNKNVTSQSYYFYHVIYPLFFANIKAALLEYQQRLDEVAAL